MKNNRVGMYIGTVMALFPFLAISVIRYTNVALYNCADDCPPPPLSHTFIYDLFIPIIFPIIFFIGIALLIISILRKRKLDNLTK